MRRLFFSLYVLVVASLIGCVGGMLWLWENGVRDELLRSTQQIAVGLQYLFEEELRTLPVEEWPAHIDNLKAQFGYELTLLDLDEVKASPRNLQLLRQGRVALSESDQVEFMLLPLRGSKYVLRFHVEQQAREHGQRTAQGAYYLLEKQLAGYTGAERSRVLQRLEERFGYPLRSIALSHIADESERNRLRSGEIVSRDLDGPEEQYLKRLAGEEQVLQVGPFPHYFMESAINYLVWALLAGSMALAIYLWVRPLWRDMLALDHGALAIGQGNLDARVHVSARSPLRALAGTFNGMAQRVAELLKAQKEMTDAVSHELRTPISRLRFGVEMLGRTATPSDRQRYLDGIRRDIDELDSLVDEALTYSRLIKPAPRLSTEPVRLSDWLEEVMQDARRFAGATRRVSSKIAAASASATFDARLMARALNNIIRNALRYSQSVVIVTITEAAGHVDLIVEDDGPGIPPDRRQAIFEPFYRIDNNRGRESGGHGLGLAIVKRICEWHGVEISVEQSALGGALFRLRLPAGSQEITSCSASGRKDFGPFTA